MDLRRESTGEPPAPSRVSVPALEESAPGLAAVKASAASSRRNSKDWRPFLSKVGSVVAIGALAVLAVLGFVAAIGAAVLLVSLLFAILMAGSLMLLAFKLWLNEERASHPRSAQRPLGFAEPVVRTPATRRR